MKLDVATFALTVIKLMLPSTFFLILGFFGFLHSWVNLWAEITRFPDRCFYSDWWNSIEFGSYYRKWNIIVHDWLYYFIYVDTCRFTKCSVKNSFLPKLLTFMISAVIHELIITYALGFFYPILFILFTGPGTFFMTIHRHYIDTKSEESQEYFGELCVLVGDVYWVVVVVYVLFGGELCQEKNLRLVHYGTVGKRRVLYSKDYLLGTDDLIGKEVVDSQAVIFYSLLTVCIFF